MSGYIKSFKLYLYVCLCILITGCGGPPPLEQVGWVKSDLIMDLLVDDGYLYVSGEPGLSIYDLANPHRPKLISSLPVEFSSGMKIAVHNGYAYLANKLEGLAMVDVHNPAHPIRLATALPNLKANGIAIAGDIAYIVGDTPVGAGLYLFDIRDPNEITQLAFARGATTKIGSVSIALRNGFVYTFQPVALGQYDFQVWDATNPRAPHLVQSFPDFVVGGDIELVGNRAYVSTLADLSIFDIADSGRLSLVGSYRRNFGSTYALAVAGRYVYTASQMSVRAFELTKWWGPVRTHRQPVSQARDIVVYKGYLYVADLTDGLLIFKTVE